ncbi:MAG: putative toxin-antitoxin system toxin component, PIN family [Actinomycetes bacterium]
MTRRVACDTNVLVSAFIAQGPPSRVIEEAINGSFDLVLLQPSLDELARILTTKLDFNPEQSLEVLELLTDLASAVQPAPDGPAEPVSGDPDDDLILACAAEAELDALVSGDRRHLLPLEVHAGFRIVTPQAFLADLRS